MFHLYDQAIRVLQYIAIIITKYQFVQNASAPDTWFKYLFIYNRSWVIFVQELTDSIGEMMIS